MPEMKTWTVGETTYEIVDAKAREAINEINTARENGEFKGEAGKSAYEYAQDGGYTGTKEEFAEKLAEDMPDALPNPHPLTINGKSYDGSEAVDITVTGGATSENTSLGQTPVTLTKNAYIKLVGNGEYSYTINGKTIADVSTATVAKTNATLTEKDGLLELTASGSPANWYSTYAAFTFTGLTVGESYVFCIESLGLDNVNLNTPGYFLIKNTSGTELGRINSDTTGLISVEFTADTETIVVSWYPANNYYWSDNYRTARVGDIYINKASDGTDRTGVINESGTFTDSYSFGQLQKGITITSTPSCEVYSVSVGGGSSEVSAPLAGKTVVCFGDSLFGMYTGDTSAPAFVAQKTGATVHNVGFGGCRMSEHPYTGYNEFCMYALADAIASGDWSLQDAAASSGSSNFPDQLAILKSIDFNAVDYIVIHYGTNDFAAGGGVTIDNASNPKETNTLCGALRHSVETLLAAFPKLKIFVSLPAFRYWTADDGTVTYSDEKEDVNGCTLPDFVKALADTAKEYKLPVIDCYYGIGINKSNAATFLADGTHHNIDGRKRFGEYIGAKLISEGDTFRSTDTESGGSSIDVTTSVGQTIVVEEVDANGKPTKWKAAEYQPRTHWSEYTEIVLVDNQTCNGDSTTNFDFLLVAGQSYHVVFNGAEYDCVARTRDMDGMTFLILGNESIMGAGSDTGEPFLFQSMAGVGTVPTSADGSNFTLTLSTAQETIHTMPAKYLPDEVANYAPYYITGIRQPSDNTFFLVENVALLEALIDAKRQIILQLIMNDSNHTMAFLPLAYYTPPTTIDSYGTTVVFASAVARLHCVPQEDGTYAVAGEVVLD